MARLRFPALAAVLFVALTGTRPASTPPPAGVETAEELRGTARVTDGDTLRIGATRIRLFGIDAPESRQLCPDETGRTWDCGVAAARKLEALVAGRVVRCFRHDIDRYGRTVASCSVDDRDIGDALVREGLARAYARYSDRYTAAEAAAQAAHRGLWRADAEAPWDWRRHRNRRSVAPGGEPVATAGAAAECSIKGNVSGDGRRLYHTPAMASWSRTRIDPARGERFFCDEAAARAAGWLPASGGAR